MKKILLLGIGALCHIHASAQENLAIIADSIRREGILLYQLIQTCNTGVELFESDTTGRLSLRAAGFFSYREDSKYVLVMPHRDSYDHHRPGRATSCRLDSSLNPKTAETTVGRGLTDYEKEVFELWKLVHIMLEKDAGFKKARDTYFMVVPIVEGASRKVYVLSASSRNSNFVLGNDYLLYFNNAHELIAKKEFHTNLLMTPKGRKSSGHIHGRANSPYITATDVCAFMLHPKAFDQASMRVVSPTHISEWNMADNTLYIEPRMQ